MTCHHNDDHVIFNIIANAVVMAALIASMTIQGCIQSEVSNRNCRPCQCPDSVRVPDDAGQHTTRNRITGDGALLPVRWQMPVR